MRYLQAALFVVGCIWPNRPLWATKCAPGNGVRLGLAGILESPQGCIHREPHELAFGAAILQRGLEAVLRVQEVGVIVVTGGIAIQVAGALGSVNSANTDLQGLCYGGVAADIDRVVV